MSNIQEIIDNFSFLDEWEDRYRYLIELGRTLPPFPEDKRTAEYKVEGCASQVWLAQSLVRKNDKSLFVYEGDSDAHLVKGIVALVLALYSGKEASEIMNIDAMDVFSKIGLKEHLSPQRSNGLHAMISRIRQDAAITQSTVSEK